MPRKHFAGLTRSCRCAISVPIGKPRTSGSAATWPHSLPKPTAFWVRGWSARVCRLHRLAQLLQLPRLRLDLRLQSPECSAAPSEHV